MSYKNRMRFITNKKGYNSICKHLKFYGEEVLNDLINNNTCKYFDNLIYLFWNNSSNFRFIKSIIMATITPDIPYRIYMEDSSDNSIYKCSNVIGEFQNKNMPEIFVTCVLNDTRTNEELKKNNMTNNKKINGGAYGL